MRRETVLMIGEDGDGSIEAVELDARRVPFFRFDTADLPQRSLLTARFGGPELTSWVGELVTSDGRVSLDDVTAVYYRRPRDFDVASLMSEPER